MKKISILNKNNKKDLNECFTKIICDITEIINWRNFLFKLEKNSLLDLEPPLVDLSNMQLSQLFISELTNFRGFNFSFVYNDEIIKFLKIIKMTENYIEKDKDIVEINQIFNKFEFSTNFDIYFDMNFIYISNSKGKTYDSNLKKKYLNPTKMTSMCF
jgi:hypothetical protein